MITESQMDEVYLLLTSSEPYQDIALLEKIKEYPDHAQEYLTKTCAYYGCRKKILLANPCRKLSSTNKIYFLGVCPICGFRNTVLSYLDLDDETIKELVNTPHDTRQNNNLTLNKEETDEPKNNL